MPSASVKPRKKRWFVAAVIASLAGCLFLAACGLRAAQSGGANTAFLNAPPLPPGAAREAVLWAGREAARLIGERNGTALFAKFSPQMAAAVPQSAITQSLKQGPVPVGSPIGEIVSGSENAPVYYALYPTQNGNGQIAVTVSFNSERADKIAGLLISLQAKPASQNVAMKLGRVAATLIAKKDTDGLYALFAPDMVRALPKARIQAVLEQMITPQKAVGAKIGEIIVPVEGDENGPLAYAAEFAYGPDNTLKILMSFTLDNQKLTSLRLVPGLPHTLAPDPHANYQMKTKLHLPFAPGDQWTIVWGGDTREQN